MKQVITAIIITIALSLQGLAQDTSVPAVTTNSTLTTAHPVEVPAMVVLPQKSDQPALAMQWGWADSTNLLSLVKQVEVDGGIASHFSNMKTLAPSTAQHYVLARLHRGNWHWNIVSVMHADSFFDEGTEDEMGLSTSLVHVRTPDVITEPIDKVKPSAVLDVSSFKISAGVYSETGALFGWHLDSHTSGLRMAVTLPAFK